MPIFNFDVSFVFNLQCFRQLGTCTKLGIVCQSIAVVLACRSRRGAQSQSRQQHKAAFALISNQVECTVSMSASLISLLEWPNLIDGPHISRLSELKLQLYPFSYLLAFSCLIITLSTPDEAQHIFCVKSCRILTQQPSIYPPHRTLTAGYG